MYSSRSRKNRLLTLSFTFFTMFLIILMSQSNVNPSLNDEITENQMIDGNPQTSFANCPIFDGLYVNNTN